jgi:hypothetical protein
LSSEKIAEQVRFEAGQRFLQLQRHEEPAADGILGQGGQGRARSRAVALHRLARPRHPAVACRPAPLCPKVGAEQPHERRPDCRSLQVSFIFLSTGIKEGVDYECLYKITLPSLKAIFVSLY